MNKIFLGYDKQYAYGWNRVFKKSIIQKFKDKIDKILFYLFIKESNR
jgi:hypothetical protein